MRKNSNLDGTSRESFQVDDFELNVIDNAAALPLLEESSPESGSHVDTEETFELDDASQGVFTKIWYQDEEVVMYPANYEKVPVVRVQIAAMLLLFVMFGITDEVNGSLLPTITEYYNVTELQVSVVYFLQLIGYMLASGLNDILHRKWGSQGVMTASCITASLTYAVLALKPFSLYLYALCFLPLGLCIGFMDSTGNFYFGNLEIRKNELMGLLHGMYGLAAGVTPPLVTTLDYYFDWSYVFWIPCFFAVAGLVLCRVAFRYETPVKYRYVCDAGSDSSSEGETDYKWYNLSRFPPMIYLYALFLFLYLGTEIGVGTWLFTYLLKYQQGERFLMSFVTSAFWSGITVGRLGLGFVTKKFKNEYWSSVWYGWTCSLFFSLFLLISMINSNSNFYYFMLSVMIFGAGVFMGPLFPNASVVAIQILPKNLQVSGIGTATALGGCGAAAITYGFGYFCKVFGFKYFPALCFFAALSFNVLWMLYPKFIKGHREYL
ncbi:unnamed protein product [Kluyveromyces dobzhanskii CBS 2104]|uniref:WGS project CCBQ000000000 data, contig 00106 n=1 Tax=Kluyveromyces dobzhanskii CBS 2104 TaxID=1427455 RepID=A0A0A8L820_9SACH|nr:unnamed protein product [Kluyveromyces dobzhanskii CBS 2104]